MVLATSMLVTDTSSKKVIRVPYIYYPVQFQKNQEQVKALLNSNSKVNVMNPTFAQKLGLFIWITNIGARTINGSALVTFRMVIANLEVENKAGRFKFFQETFLVVETKFEIVLGMFFLKISNADISFGEKTLM